MSGSLVNAAHPGSVIVLLKTLASPSATQSQTQLYCPRQLTQTRYDSHDTVYDRLLTMSRKLYVLLFAVFSATTLAAPFEPTTSKTNNLAYLENASSLVVNTSSLYFGTDCMHTLTPNSSPYAPPIDDCKCFSVGYETQRHYIFEAITAACDLFDMVSFGLSKPQKYGAYQASKPVHRG